MQVTAVYCIGLVNCYHLFLPQGAELMQPLHALLASVKHKTQTLTWNETALAAFQDTKEALAKDAARTKAGTHDSLPPPS